MSLERSESQKIAVRVVESISEEVSRTKDGVGRLQEMVASLPDQEDPEHAKEALKTVDKLQYKCRCCSMEGHHCL